MESDGGGDPFMLLPDSLLESIVSLLPPKSGARTVALSRRWRSIWPSHPLHVDFQDVQTWDDLGGRFLDDGALLSMLSSHRGPIRRFSIISYPDSSSTPAWVGALLQIKEDSRNIDSLTLKFGREGFRPQLPLQLLASSSSTLRHLELRFCSCLVVDVPSFPLLECLRLAWVEISDTALASLLAGCPALCELSLESMPAVRRIALRSRTLATARIITCRHLDELCIPDAPSLRTLSFHYMDLWRIKLPVSASPPGLEIGLTLLLPTTSQMPLPLVTSLHFSMEFNSAEKFKEAARILTLFPRLRRLQIQCLDSGSSSKYKGCYRGWPPAPGTIACLNHHLTHVLLQGYYATKGEQEFATFLVSQAMSLTFIDMIHSAHWTLQTIESHRRAICRRGVASSVAQLRFTKLETKQELPKHLVKHGFMAPYLHTTPLV